MGKAVINFYSENLKRNVDVNVLLPEQYGYGSRQKGHPIKENFPVLYLLHGYNSDMDAWDRNSQVPFFSRDLPLAIVMPSGYNAWYGYGYKTGMNYIEFLVNELPKKLSEVFNISTKREDTFIAGLSMGGFGATLAGLKYPEKFSRVVSLSGVVDLERFFGDGQFKTTINHDRDINLGTLEEVRKRGFEFKALLKENVENNVELPKFFVSCGDVDPVLEYNRDFKKELEKYNVDFEYSERPGGHDWVYWNQLIVEVFKWLPLEKY